MNRSAFTSKKNRYDALKQENSYAVDNLAYWNAINIK